MDARSKLLPVNASLAASKPCRPACQECNKQSACLLAVHQPTSTMQKESCAADCSAPLFISTQVFYPRVEPVSVHHKPTPDPVPFSASVSASELASARHSSKTNSPLGATDPLTDQLGGLALDDNWQTSKRTIRERNAVMLLSEVMSDVHFLVGSEPEKRMRLPAHRYVLATSSSVFFAMFYGPLAEAKAEIEIPDVEPSAFIAMLRYLYTDHVQIEADSVLSVLYCSKKYLLPHLAKICVKYLESNLTAQNACLLLSQSRLFDETDLVQRCFEVIDAQAELALTSEGFAQVDCDTLQRILSRETLNAKEVTIFEAALQWAAAECKRQKLEPTADNQRAILGDILFNIRIPTMTLEEFANGPAQASLLTVQEINDIFLHYTATKKPNLKFPTKPRFGLTLQKCHRFLSSAYRSNQWRYRGRCDSIQFRVDKHIFVVGFGLYGSSNGAAEYKVKIELKRVDVEQREGREERIERVLSTKHTRFFSDGSSNTFAVYFDYPIQIEAEPSNTGAKTSALKEFFYIASAVLDGSELSYFGQDGLSEVAVDGVVNFSFNCSADSTNGTGVQGGQIPEILFYAPTK